jgi:hypothetical protein
MTDPTADDRTDRPGAAAPPPEVQARLGAWLEEQGMLPPDDYSGWAVSDAGQGSWVLTPPGMAGVIFAVTLTTIRAIQPAFESVPDALRELGIQ